VRHLAAVSLCGYQLQDDQVAGQVASLNGNAESISSSSGELKAGLIGTSLSLSKTANQNGGLSPRFDLNTNLNYALKSFLRRTVKPSKPKPTSNMA
jgi:hypothetical protein